MHFIQYSWIYQIAYIHVSSSAFLFTCCAIFLFASPLGFLIFKPKDLLVRWSILLHPTVGRQECIKWKTINLKKINELELILPLENQRENLKKKAKRAEWIYLWANLKLLHCWISDCLWHSTIGRCSRC